MKFILNAFLLKVDLISDLLYPALFPATVSISSVKPFLTISHCQQILKVNNFGYEYHTSSH